MAVRSVPDEAILRLSGAAVLDRNSVTIAMDPEGLQRFAKERLFLQLAGKLLETFGDHVEMSEEGSDLRLYMELYVLKPAWVEAQKVARHAHG